MQWLDKRNGDAAPGKSTVIDTKFKGDFTNTDDAERSSHPRGSANQENIKK